MTEETLTKKSELKNRKKKHYNTSNSSLWILYLFVIPAIVITFIFSYLPMFGNVIAFLDYDFSAGWMGLKSPFVGLANFSFINERWFYELAIRTVEYSFFILLFSFPAPLILALLINELRSEKYKKVVQTISYIPHFVSWTTVAGLFYLFLTVDDTGIINNIKCAIFGGERISYMQDTKYFLPVLITSQIWKEIGWGTILYLAAITQIDPQLYEAAEVDGAGRFKKMLHITLPGILPTTAILLIFSFGGLFSTNFDQILNFQNPVIRESTDTINMFTYYVGILGQQYSLSTAVGLFQGLITFILLRTTNYVVKKLTSVGIF